MDIGAVAAGVISQIAGGGRPDMRETEATMKLLREITQRGVDLYDNTDLAALDQQVIDATAQNANQDTMAALDAYDAMMAGRGSSIFKDSTAKGRARTQIAYEGGRDARSLAANLASTRANRQAALLPNPAGAVNGLQGAMAMDTFRNNNLAANQGSLFNIAYSILNRGSSPQGGKVNSTVGGPLVDQRYPITLGNLDKQGGVYA